MNATPESIKPFFIVYKVLWAILVGLFLIGSVLLTLYGLSFTEDDGYVVPTAGKIEFLIPAIFVLIISFLFMFFIGLVIPIVFKKSQDQFLKTKLYQQNKHKYNDEIFLEKQTPKQLKKLKKLLYIDNGVYQIYKQKTQKSATKK